MHIEIQHVSEPIYKANSPDRTFAKARFVKFMESIGSQMVFSFQGFDEPHYRGFLFFAILTDAQSVRSLSISLRKKPRLIMLGCPHFIELGGASVSG
jgi:hypothetical protein